MKLIFTGGHISLAVAFKGPNVILGLYECNYSLTRGKMPPPGRNKVPGWIKRGGGPDVSEGLVFATCALKEMFSLEVFKLYIFCCLGK